MEIDIISFILGMIPILWLFIALLVIKMEGYKASIIALIISSILAYSHWRMSLVDVFTAIIEGFLFTLWPIVLVVVAAIFTYRVVTLTGAIDKINKFISDVTVDKRILVLLIGWCFAGFLEGIAGFGAPIAIAAGLLWGLGFDPILAAVSCIIGNIVVSPFGAIGILTLSVAEVTNISADILSMATIKQFAPLTLLTPFIMILIISKGKLKSLKGVSLTAFISGLSFLFSQMIVLRYLGTEMVGVIPPIISIVFTVIISKYLMNKEVPEEYIISTKIDQSEVIDNLKLSDIFLATLPFVIILFLFFLTSDLFPNINKKLSSISSELVVYTGDNPTTLKFQWINSPGVLIIISTLIGGIFQGATLNQMWQIFLTTIKQIYKTIITLLSVIAMAKVIGYSGMMVAISAILILITGKFYPFFAPIIGMIGGFATGSAMSSGILFGVMQVETANMLGVSGVTLVGANSMGGSIGKVIAPQALAIAASTTGLAGKESEIFSKAIKWITIYIILVCITAGIASKFNNIF